MPDDSASARASTVEEWTAALAESTGSPGGGAASGVMLAIAHSLTSMVAGYTSVSGELADELSALRARAAAGRETALRLADSDAAASESFGSAFRLQPHEGRADAIREASVQAAHASADLGTQGVAAVGDLEWLAEHGKPALIADVAVACGALRAAVAGARANVNFDLSALESGSASAGSAASAGSVASVASVAEEHPVLWETVQQLDAVLARIDRLAADIEGRERLNPGE